MISRSDSIRFRSAARSAARAAGRVLLRHFSKPIRVDFKGDLNLVTEADREAEALIIKKLKNAFPRHGFLAEEGGGRTVSGAPVPRYKWIIDPLDGTTNFAHHFPFFCVSIALEKDGEVILGLVLDPIRKELFFAEKGRGADLNGRPIRVSGAEKINESLLVTGFAYDLRQDMANNLDHFGRFVLRARGVRRTGSAALDLCYVASGRFDGFWEMKLSPWDTAAGALILAEAGGRVTTFSGGAYSIYLREILASNGRIHAEMVDVLNPP